MSGVKISGATPVVDAKAALAGVQPEPRRVRPTAQVEQKRVREANGKPAEEAVDTIGRLWCWDLLAGGKFSADHLRDAGRRYATLYWFRYGPVCAHSGTYSEMITGGGIPSIVIPDPERDEHAERQFMARDGALLALDRRAKRVIDQLCVDGHGDNDPSWLTELMTAYPAHTAHEREKLDEAITRVTAARGKDEKRKAKRAFDDATRAHDKRVRQLRRERVPHQLLAAVRAALDELAEIDRREGYHRPLRMVRNDAETA